MEDEFEKIMALFALEPKEKEKRLDEIFKLAIAFIEKYQEIQEDGTPEDKKEVNSKLTILKNRITEETKASERKLSLSHSEIKKLSEDKENFTPEQWELLQKTKAITDKERSNIKEKQKAAVDKKLKPIKKKKSKKKSKRGSSTWLKS